MRANFGNNDTHNYALAGPKLKRCMWPYNCFGGSPVVVFHRSPGGTSQSPLQCQFQSVFWIFSRIASTKVSTGHMPSFCSGQPLIPVRGATPSLIMMRICEPGEDVHSRTRAIQLNWSMDDEDVTAYAGIVGLLRKARALTHGICGS